MKQVISASRRTDIPAFYLRWLLDRIGEGYVDVANPQRRTSIRRISLSPQEVGWIVFWSKNYGVFQRFADRFDAYDLFFQFTINAPSALLEPDVPTSEEALRQVEFLTGRYGAARLNWRYDPIVCWQEQGRIHSNLDLEWFERMCRDLGQLGVTRCSTSFMSVYAKVTQRVRQYVPGIRLIDPPVEQKKAWATVLRDIAAAHGIVLAGCCDAALVDMLARGACVNGPLLNTLSSSRVSCARAATRPLCGCTASADIGDYDLHECGYACLYCYANPNHRRFARAVQPTAHQSQH
jgi:hypothetical protein